MIPYLLKSKNIKFWPKSIIYHVMLFSQRGVLDTTLCDKVCQWLAAVLWFSPSTPIFPKNKTDHQDIAEILWTNVIDVVSQH